MPLFNKKLLQETVAKHKHEIASDRKLALKTLFQETLSRIEMGKFGKEESEKVLFLQRLFEFLGYKLHENLEFEYSTQGRSIDGVLGEFNVAETPSLHENPYGKQGGFLYTAITTSPSRHRMERN